MAAHNRTSRRRGIADRPDGEGLAPDRRLLAAAGAIIKLRSDSIFRRAFMVGTYAYSLDGQRDVGSFETRQQALTVGLDAVRQRQTPPESVYVGRHIPADPKASGHARMILSNMAARAREEAGDAGEE